MSLTVGNVLASCCCCCCCYYYSTIFSLSKDLFIFTEHSKDSAILVIDNLSTMLLQYTCSEVCQLIHTLS